MQITVALIILTLINQLSTLYSILPCSQANLLIYGSLIHANENKIHSKFIIIQLIFMRQPRAYHSPHFYFHQIKPRQYQTKVGIEFQSDAMEIPRRALAKVKKGDQNGNVKFRSNDWNAFSMQQVCERIKKWDIEKGLYIQSSKQPTIIQQISKIQFSFLLSLNLSGNNIQTIESLCTINAPNLQRLILSQNKITSIQSMRKANFPKLISCSLGSNKIMDYSPFCEMQGPGLNQIYQEHRADSQLCNTFTWIAKLDTNSLQRLWVNSDNRIWQKKAQNALERKFLRRKEITFYVGLINYTE